MVQELLNKYIWLIDLLSRAGRNGLSLSEIQRSWEDRWDGEYSRRSFCNHREAIADVFGVEIACDRSANRYYIAGDNPAADPGGERAWLINSFTVNNLLSLGKGKLSGRVSVEEIPSGRKWLTAIMGAMERNRELAMHYRKYTGSSEEYIHVRPYGLREHEKRWYLAGWCEERAALRVYGLDRIMDLEDGGKKFSMPKDFDIEELFAGSYGIYLPMDRKTERIVLRAGEREARYLRDLPMHASQRETSPGVFELRAVPDLNLVMDLCKRGDRIEVLQPRELREQVAEEHRKAFELYEKDNIQ